MPEIKPIHTLFIHYMDGHADRQWDSVRDLDDAAEKAQRLFDSLCENAKRSIEVGWGRLSHEPLDMWKERMTPSHFSLTSQSPSYDSRVPGGKCVCLCSYDTFTCGRKSERVRGHNSSCTIHADLGPDPR